MSSKHSHWSSQPKIKIKITGGGGGRRLRRGGREKTIMGEGEEKLNKIASSLVW